MDSTSELAALGGYHIQIDSEVGLRVGREIAVLS